MCTSLQLQLAFVVVIVVGARTLLVATAMGQGTGGCEAMEIIIATEVGRDCGAMTVAGGSSSRLQRNAREQSGKRKK